MKRFIFILISLCSISAFAEERPLDKIAGFTCEFPTSTVNDWQEEAPAPALRKDQKFSFRLDSIDAAKGTAKIIGTGGASNLKVMPYPESLHFIEAMESGNVNLTTIYNSPTKDGKYKAVHSRHMKIGDPLPSQGYGFCRPK